MVTVRSRLHVILEDLAAQDMTIAELSERSGVPVATILAVGRGEKQPTMLNAIHVAHALGVDPEYIMRRVGLFDIHALSPEIELRHCWQYLSRAERVGILVALRALVAAKAAHVAHRG